MPLNKSENKEILLFQIDKEHWKEFLALHSKLIAICSTIDNKTNGVSLGDYNQIRMILDNETIELLQSFNSDSDIRKEIQSIINVELVGIANLVRSAGDNHVK